ncbi:lipoyl transferase [Colletotrichum sojae]|uniref:lipoyl(octanoyl) transferase n=1 Tax=Colletotrichum sojae TaxID=2175907 RepID=A0A8H6N0S5_9PEZI|nr:lipoyl transferase [Colletotrichum sojae]
MGPPRTASLLRALSTQRFLRPSIRAPKTIAPSHARWSSSKTPYSLVFPEDDGADPSALRHVHLSGPDDELPSYNAASDFQTALRQVYLDWKSSPTARAPSPLVVSFTSTPTYTLGRRQKTLTEDQLARLRQPLSVGAGEYNPEVVETDRGGLTTYHGPGQVVLWPILDLRSAYFPPLTVRSYARLLEQTTQAVLADGPGVATYLSEEDPGVWTEAARAGGQERKIAAMGVHLRRHVSGLGTALNVDVAVDGAEAANPWARFVPCGLEGKTATSVEAEVGRETWAAWRDACDVRAERKWYARRWVEELARRLGVEAAPETVRHRLQ